MIFSPVVGAIDVIAQAHQISFLNKKVVVVGNGLLVGRPAAEYARAKGARVTMITKDATASLALEIRDADIFILGSGVSGIVTKDMVQEGVIIFDAGTSEDNGKLSGDADPACAEKASLFTPVPGGIGPLTVAVLFHNLVTLVQNRSTHKIDGAT